MEGGFVLIVGPSGAGKDTLIGLARERLAADERFVFPRRLVTRASSAFEDHDTVDEASFTRDWGAGLFPLAWRAHGLGYALPGSAREAALAGRIVICNVSRAVVEEGRRTLPNVSVVEITASEEVLAQRLHARARADDGELSHRLARSRTVPPVHADLVIVNEAAPEKGAEMLVGFLRGKVPPFSSRASEARPGTVLR
jgi:ribose 1,5-bisphosphokinase